LRPLGVDLPGASEKVEGAMSAPTTVASALGKTILGPDRFFDGTVFDFGMQPPPCMQQSRGFLHIYRVKK